MPQADVDSSKQPVNYQVLIPQEYYGGHQDDEISLIDLFLILWKKRFWIIGLTGLITVISVFYAFSLKPVYEAQAYLLPPEDRDIEVLNLLAKKRDEKEGDSAKVYTSKSVFSQALANLKSRQYQWLYFEQAGLLKLYVKETDPDVRPRDVFNKQFHSSLKLTSKDDENKVSFTYADKQEVARILNQYIAFISDSTVKTIVDNIMGAVRFETHQIELQILQLRQNALLQRQDRIQQIKEQIAIARKLNIHSNKLVDGALRSEDGKEPPSHYLEGTKALQIKLDALTSRKSDDPFIRELRPLQARLSVLKKADIDETQVKAFRIDQEALVPKYPIKPKKRLIAMLGFVLGLMLSVFAVFIWHFIEKYRDEHHG